MNTKQPNVAGIFYPEQADELNAVVSFMLEKAQQKATEIAKEEGLNIPLIIVPHAGYVYSGQVAADSYHYLKSSGDQIKRVVVLGPAHRVAIKGCATVEEDYFQTPLGDIPIDKALVESLMQLPFFKENSHAHINEHSIEVQLPFLQHCLTRFSLVPVVCGQVSTREMATIFSLLPKADDLLVVISTDLSHFNQYQDALEIDRQTMQAIEQNLFIKSSQACGATIVNGLMGEAGLIKKRGLQLHKVSYANSGDITGLKESVVGYVSYYAS